MYVKTNQWILIFTPPVNFLTSNQINDQIKLIDWMLLTFDKYSYNY